MNQPILTFDPTVLADLAEFIPEETLRGFLATFFEGVETLSEELPNLSRSDVRFQVHRLASGAWAVGIPALADAATGLERKLGETLTESCANDAIADFDRLLRAALRDLDPETVLRALYTK
jgi:HPt (histidine-containing phosphotransfer) domain-containing protein